MNWIDATGYECLIDAGAGWIRVPESHPFYFVEHDEWLQLAPPESVRPEDVLLVHQGVLLSGSPHRGDHDTWWFGVRLEDLHAQDAELLQVAVLSLARQLGRVEQKFGE